jgi:hypothetical protein
MAKQCGFTNTMHVSKSELHTIVIYMNVMADYDSDSDYDSDQIFGGVLPACWHQHRGYIRFGSGLCILRAGSNEGIEGESEAVRIFKVHEYQRSNPSVGVEQWVRER